ncbi:hypothetical protein BDW69DRAFT_43432 [Aspergillus filifer]
MSDAAAAAASKSYADAAKKGPKQSPEEVRAPDINHVYKDESESTASMIDVDKPHVQSVEPDFLEQEVKTDTQAERIEREEAEAQAARENEKEKAKAKASRARSNESNPVFLGNAAVLALVGAGLGFGAYKKHTQGKLSWELVGLWTGAVGAFGAIDYFVSKLVFLFIALLRCLPANLRFL